MLLAGGLNARTGARAWTLPEASGRRDAGAGRRHLWYSRVAVSNVTQPKQTVAVEVAGQRLRLSAHADPQHIERLAGMVNERVETIQRAARGAGMPTILALLALDLADELHATRRRADEAQARSKDELERTRAHARQVEQSAREAIAEVLSEIDRALVVEEPDAPDGP